MTKEELLKKLELEDAFKDYAPMKEAVLGGWNSDSKVFQFVIESAKPKLIIEVGSFVGFSTITMAKHLDRLELPCTILCIDTWLGSLEYWRDKKSMRDSGMQLDHGYPGWYWSFLTNIAMTKHQNRVVPLPLPTLIAARLLKEKGVTADLIYIDASHDEKDVYDDMEAYWPIVNSGGALFGDDWQWDSVARAVERFCKERRLEFQHDAVNWIIQKQ